MISLSAKRDWCGVLSSAFHGSQVISGMLPRSLTQLSCFKGNALCCQSAYHMTIAAWRLTALSNPETVPRSLAVHDRQASRASGSVVTPSWYRATLAEDADSAGGTNALAARNVEWCWATRRMTSVARSPIGISGA